MQSVSSNAVARALETGNNANGSYVKLATGLLLQWGIIHGVVFNSNTPQQQTITYTLPISFVDSNYSIICNLLDPIRGTNSGTPNLASPRINTKSAFDVMYTKNYTMSWDTTGTDLYWQAVGFWK